MPALTLPDTQHLPDLVVLSQYEAVALFIERAQAVKPDFQVTNTNAPAVAEICARLDGLPLAIELAAARSSCSPTGPPGPVGAAFDPLDRSARDVPARQQTLPKTIQWSYDLLNTHEQCIFRRLSVFFGGVPGRQSRQFLRRPGTKSRWCWTQYLHSSTRTCCNKQYRKETIFASRCWRRSASTDGDALQVERWKQPVGRMRPTTSSWLRKQHRD